MAKFYQQTKDVIMKQFSVNETTGLSDQQVKQNREKYGPNKLAEQKADPYWKVILKGFKEPLVLVLWGAIILSLLSSFYSFKVQNNPQHGREAIYEASAIFVLIIVNAFLSFWQEITARKSLDSLKEMNSRFAAVLRNGHWQHISTTELVVGDIIKVKMGDFVEADVRWINTDELQVIESHLTGEPDAIQKNTAVITEKVEVGDRFNMGFSGSTVSHGQGTGLIVATGENTELGNIACLIQDVEVKIFKRWYTKTAENKFSGFFNYYK